MNADDLKIKKEVLAAGKRLRNLVRETPLEFSPFLSEAGGCRVYIKCENLQLTGSFKIRGAANKLLSLSETGANKRVITASSGNHGVAMAYISKKMGYPGIVVLPENASPAKVQALRMTGSEIRFFGDDCVKAELYARDVALKENLSYISPYNDIKIIGGQGTVGYEMQRQMKYLEPGKGIDSVLVPVGGGGLIAGISGYLKSVCPGIEIIGCQPALSAVMFESIKAGRIVELQNNPTISDGSAGGIEPGAITFDVCRALVDQFILVSEAEIRDAILLIMSRHHLLVEGAAVLSVAAFLKKSEYFRKKNVILVMSGSRIGMDRLKEIFCGENPA
jgi:threonine dehydratase